MKKNEVRHQVISALLQASGPMTLPELLKECGLPRKEVQPVLKELVSRSQVAEGQLLADKPGPQYCWGARWAKETERSAATAKQRLQAAVDAVPAATPGELGLDSIPVTTFHDFIIEQYEPPKEKRFLVFLQCSVRRPFSTSPSHASMRRAISVATGFDPAKEFESCPVHVVVLASRVGPVPYELEDVYPANVSSGGVKHFHPDHYARAKPILAERMGQYMTVHRDHYEHMATFTDGRYSEVMEEAREVASAALEEELALPIFPEPNGLRLVQMGKSKPRTYWAKYWVQLYNEIVTWLEPPRRKEAAARLKKLQVKCEGGG